jgi:hypothetical protein
MVFFEKEENLNVFDNFLKKIKNIDKINKFEEDRNKSICIISESIVKSPKDWDSKCDFNISSIGEFLLNSLIGFNKESNKNEIDDIASSFFRFLIEYSISTRTSIDLELEYAKRVISDNSDKYSESAEIQINYALRDMLVLILKNLLNSSEIKNLKNITSIIEQKNIIEERWEKMISEKQDAWNEEVSDREERVSEIKESLEKYETAFNFVGLYQGFDDLLKSKRKERVILLVFLIALALVIVSPLIFEIKFIFDNPNSIGRYKDAALFLLMPTLSLIVITTYFFRVLLSNYKSVKSQIMQIELRMTLCRFIQSYADYSADLKGKNETTLNKFEEIIFSNILSSDTVSLSAFDGMEKFSALVKSTKK